MTRAHEQFQELSIRHAEAARAFIRKRLGKALRKRVDTDDVLQESLLQASRLFVEREAERGMDGKEFLAWFREIIENKIRNLAHRHVAAARRSVKREEPIEALGGATSFPSHQRTPSAELLEAESTKQVLDAVDRLPPRQREVVRLVHFQKLRVAEAAARLGNTPGSTAVLLHKAIERLREMLKGKER